VAVAVATGVGEAAVGATVGTVDAVAVNEGDGLATAGVGTGVEPGVGELEGAGVEAQPATRRLITAARTSVRAM
jgi:hypothetical protein